MVLLRGTVPALPAASAAGGDDEDDDGESRLRGRARLAPTEPGLEGYVEVRSRPEKGRERFKIEAEHLAPGRRVEFFVEDSVASGVFTSYGTLAADVEGEAELKLRTEDGQALPAGATRVTELTGLRVEVRDPTDGTVLLAGTVPQPLID